MVEMKDIGTTTADVFIAEVGDIVRFDNTKELQKLAGLKLVSDRSGRHCGKTKLVKREISVLNICFSSLPYQWWVRMKN